MEKTKTEKKPYIFKEPLITFWLPVVLILLALVAYFVLRWGKLMSHPANRNGGVGVVAVDGSQDYINLGPERKSVIVDVASTEASREQGLSGRPGLDQSHGMLFVFEKPEVACFWMKGMLFDIDMLWFDQDLKLIHIQREATPASYPEAFCPPQPAKYVIEVAAGTADRLHLKIGDSFIQP